MKKWKKFIGTKAFYKATLVVAIPMMLQQLVSSSVSLIDNLMVGQLGDAALAGVAAVNKFYMIAVFSTNGLLASSSLFLAQYFGAKNKVKMKESFRFSLVFAMFIMGTFFVVSWLFPRVIVGFFTPDEAIISAGLVYFRVMKYSFLPMAISLGISVALRSIGETKSPMGVSIAAVIVDTILNYGLAFGNFGLPNLGVTGVALATVLSRILEAVIFVVVLIYSKAPFKTALKDLFKIPFGLMKSILIKAAPLTTNEILWSLGMATLFKLYGTCGPEVMSGYAIANTIADLFFILFGGMAAATTVLISHHLGANQLEEARGNGYRLIGFGAILSVAFGVMMFTSSFFIPDWFQVSESAKEVTRMILRIMSAMFWIYVINTQIYFTLRAGGDTKSTFFMDSVYMWCINIPVVVLVAYGTNFPIYILYIAGQATDIIKMIIGYRMVRKEKWVVNLTRVNETELIPSEIEG